MHEHRACNPDGLLVEKLDLVGLYKPITDRYGIPLYCGRGSTDGHTRMDMLRRAYVFGFTALTIGVLLAIFIFSSLLGGLLH